MEHLKDQLEKSRTRPELLKLRNQVLLSPPLFQELMDAYLHGPSRISQRAAGLVCSCLEKDSQLLLPYFSSLTKKLQDPLVPDATKRNTLRILQFAEIPEEMEGTIMDFCFRYLESGKEAVAVKAFSMTVLYRLSEKYPEIKTDLKILIEDQLPFQKPGFVARGKKVLKKL